MHPLRPCEVGFLDIGLVNSRYGFKVRGGRVGLSAIGFSVMLLDMEETEHRHLGGHGAINESTGQSSTEPIDGHYFQIKLLGSNKQSKAIADMPLAGHNNYFLGNDTCRWATHALAFASILYPDVYDGIDFRVSSMGTNLKYDFILKPGADPSKIKIEYSGVYGVEKSGDELEIQTAVGSLTEQKPISFQIGFQLPSALVTNTWQQLSQGFSPFGPLPLVSIIRELR